MFYVRVNGEYFKEKGGTEIKMRKENRNRFTKAKGG